MNPVDSSPAPGCSLPPAVPRVFEALAEWREYRAGPECAGCSFGFVPTSGALHAGHRSLLERAADENDLVVLGILADPGEHPGPVPTLAADCEAAAGLAQFVLAPPAAEMFADGHRCRVTGITDPRGAEGVRRAGPADDRLTLMLKLLNLVQARRVYFGEKDWPQLERVRGLVEALFVPTEIVACPTVREADGLALGSRNRRLSPRGRARAAAFARILRAPVDLRLAVAALRAEGFEVEYVEERDGRRLAAVWLEGVRLVDNVRL